jgi:hypothetical protein
MENVTLDTGVNCSGGTAMIRDVVIESRNGAGFNNNGCQAVLEDVTVNGASIANLGATSLLELKDVRITNTSGVQSILNSFSGIVKISNSSIDGGTQYTIKNIFSAITYVTHSQLLGGPVSGATVCAGVTDENYVFYSNICPQ